MVLSIRDALAERLPFITPEDGCERPDWRQACNHAADVVASRFDEYQKIGSKTAIVLAMAQDAVRIRNDFLGFRDRPGVIH